MIKLDNKKLMQILNIFSFILMLIANMLAVILPLNNKSTAELSDAYPNLFVPAGITFSIWSIIYILLGVFSYYQAKDLLKKEKGTLPFLEKISFFFIVSNIANFAWIFAWHYQLVALSLIIMIILFISLLMLYLRLGIGKIEVSKGENRFIHVPISVYIGWITIATIANVTAFLVSINWDGFGLPEEFWTILVISVAIIINLLILYTRNRPFGNSIL